MSRRMTPSITCWIYKITNTVTGVCYVGQTWRSLRHRFNLHKNDAASGGHCVKLNRAILKYGIDAFRIDPLIVAHSEAIADHWEQHFIQRLDTIQNGYNIREGGSHGRLSAETKAKMSIAQTGHRLSEETKAKLRAANLGKKHGPLSDEAKAKISAAHKGRRFSDELRTKLSLAHLGKPLSEEHRRRQSEGMQNRAPVSVETRRKISEARRGHAVSEETRRKLSLANKGRVLGPRKKKAQCD